MLVYEEIPFLAIFFRKHAILTNFVLYTEAVLYNKPVNTDLTCKMHKKALEFWFMRGLINTNLFSIESVEINFRLFSVTIVIINKILFHQPSAVKYVGTI